jgi:replicative DNA helicase
VVGGPELARHDSISIAALAQAALMTASTAVDALPVPWDPTAEAAVLGACLVAPDRVVDIVSNRLNEADFYNERHRALFTAITGLYLRRDPIDPVTVRAALQALGKLETAGGASYISELLASVLTTAHIDSYVRIVKQKSMLRQAMHVARETLFEATQPVESVEDFVDGFARKANELANKGTSTQVIRLNEAISSVIARAEKLSSNQNRGLTGVPSGFRDLDFKTNGFQPGDLVILAARPGMGKTAFALNVLVNAARDGRRATPGVFFSLEMGATQLAQRVWSSSSRVPLSSIRKGELARGQWDALYRSAEQLKDVPVFVDETSGITVQELMRKCRQLKQEHGIGLVIIDYLQLMNSSGVGNKSNREQVISDISRNLKALARELELPVIALSQLNRGVESRDDKRPLLSDLRESGAIEQDADIIIFLYRDSYYRALAAKKAARTGGRDSGADTAAPTESIDPDAEGVTEVLIAKHRSGSTGKVETMFHPPMVLFTNQQRDGEPEPSSGPPSDARTNFGPGAFHPPPPMPDASLPVGSDDPRAPMPVGELPARPALRSAGAASTSPPPPPMPFDDDEQPFVPTSYGSADDDDDAPF